jgi:hypothetical protein
VYQPTIRRRTVCKLQCRNLSTIYTRNIASHVKLLGTTVPAQVWCKLILCSVSKSKLT